MDQEVDAHFSTDVETEKKVLPGGSAGMGAPENNGRFDES